MRLVWGVLCFVSLGGVADDFRDTDLGEAGNRWVAETFQKYTTTATGCVPSGGKERRILVQGFGPFLGTSRNLSGAVVSHLAGLPGLAKTENGGWASTRKIEVEGETIEFCFLSLDVVWDLAASLLLTEINRFEPAVVMMSGIGGAQAVVEGGAQNSATSLSGYDAQGNPLREANTPWCGDKPCSLGTHVLSPDGKGVSEKVTHTWDNQKFADSLLASAREFAPELTVVAPRDARAGNDYLCNNVAYVVQSVLNGVEVRLAGGRIIFPGERAPRTAGFFHYPYSADPSEEWVQSWAGAILKALKNTPAALPVE